MRGLIAACAFVAICTSGYGRDADPDVTWPRVWMCAVWRTPFENTVRMCAEQGVDVVEVRQWTDRHCIESLAALRKYKVKGFVEAHNPLPKIKEIVEKGLPFERAVFSGGAYKGKAIDRTLFKFSPGIHDILIEPPVYSKGQPYVVKREKGVDGNIRIVKGGHYFGGRALGTSNPYIPLGTAEIIVPEKPFDGKQHIRIIPCKVLPADPGSVVENDSADGLSGPEIENRRLVRLRFDLSDCDGMMLDKVGIAVYWTCDTEGEEWKRGSGDLSVFSPLMRQKLNRDGRKCAEAWARVNGGKFPEKEIVAVRFGDENFNTTGWIDCSAGSFPLWGFSPSGLSAFAAAAPGMIRPRTWGYPEIYGVDAYGHALYAYHKACAELVRAFSEGVRSIAPTVMVFRNTTRANVWAENNDHGGAGQELLVQELDFVHLDPYPVGKHYNPEMIPFDMGYMSGLARRFGKRILPWMQAHVYNGALAHVTPADMKRMWKQHEQFSPDGMMWLGFDLNPRNAFSKMTFPVVAPESWLYAKDLFEKVHATTPAMRKQAPLAVLRPYGVRAVCCQQGSRSDGWRNPADRILAEYIKAWSIDYGLMYDVFELPPSMDASAYAALAQDLKKYRFMVSTIPYPGARVVGEGTTGKIIKPSEFSALRKSFAAEIVKLKDILDNEK